MVPLATLSALGALLPMMGVPRLLVCMPGGYRDCTMGTRKKILFLLFAEDLDDATLQEWTGFAQQHGVYLGFSPDTDAPSPSYIQQLEGKRIGVLCQNSNSPLLQSPMGMQESIFWLVDHSSSSPPPPPMGLRLDSNWITMAKEG